MQHKLVMDVNCDKEELYQIYYSISEYKDGAWGEGDSVYANYSDKGKTRTIEFTFPQDIKYIRFDLGATAASHTIKNAKITCKNDSIDINFDDFIIDGYDNMISSMKTEGDEFKVKTNGDDGYFIMDLSDYDFSKFIMDAQQKPVLVNQVVLCVTIDLMLLFGFLFLGRFMGLPIEVFRNRRLVMNLAKNDFKTKYAGSYLGIIWAFVQPVVTIAVYSFVFQVCSVPGQL